MKKMIVVSLTVLTLMAFGGSAFAANPVSQVAREKGGQHVAHCAQMMENGISALATGNCEMH
ncbi:MAG: hypothetical protein SCK29_14155 [Bacillota bacterium]|nr:hypothetical protein [Bacillota bacterium]MDW7685245.1 hypothetical protein [Bacillota bacterium]